MQTYTITVKSTAEGKRLIKQLESSKAVTSIEREALRKKLKRKSRFIIASKEDVALRKMMDETKTGRTVSRQAVFKALRSI